MLIISLSLSKGERVAVWTGHIPLLHGCIEIENAKNIITFHLPALQVTTCAFQHKLECLIQAEF